MAYNREHGTRMNDEKTKPGPEEAAVWESKTLFERVFEFSPDAMIVSNGTGTILRINTQAERLFGYHRDELVGQPVEALIPERFQKGHVAYRQNYIAQPRLRAMGGGGEL